MTKSFHHITVLLNETVEQTVVNKDGIYIDCTTGGGGHAELLLSKLGDSGKLIAFDQDPRAIKHLGEKFPDEIESGKLVLVTDKFSNIKAQVERLGYTHKVDGIYADLGVSSPQLDEAERGFSFMNDGPLDMRMDQVPGAFTAKEFVNTATMDELKRVFREYGEEPKAHFVADAIVKQREEKPFETTLELATTVKNAIFYSKKSKKHPATKVFQAIRIHINDEMGELERLLTDGFEVLRENGRFAIISFHSLEDRLIKQRFKTLAGRQKSSYVPKEFAILSSQTKEVYARLIKPFPIKPSDDEIEANPRSRSAKLRVCEKI
ncbi:16S rRNA (cytosine(1402)-N(4))-methyltransferase RsmH [bacterium]|nr:16S rRNA (cytosine(1402)-N(4))-methyltransferase RsmH [bacterium]